MRPELRASRGPLLVGAGQGPLNSELLFFDVHTLKPLNIQRTGQGRIHLDKDVRIRASADGTVFGTAYKLSDGSGQGDGVAPTPSRFRNVRKLAQNYPPVSAPFCGRSASRGGRAARVCSTSRAICATSSSSLANTASSRNRRQSSSTSLRP